MNVKAILAAILLAAAPSAARALSCACAPCPFERPAPCESDPEPPCCGDGEKESAPACSCPHFDAPAALPSEDDAPMTPCPVSAEAPDPDAPLISMVPEASRPPGRDPPSGPIPLFLLNLALRL